MLLRLKWARMGADRSMIAGLGREDPGDSESPVISGMAGTPSGVRIHTVLVSGGVRFARPPATFAMIPPGSLEGCTVGPVVFASLDHRLLLL